MSWSAGWWCGNCTTSACNDPAAVAGWSVPGATIVSEAGGNTSTQLQPRGELDLDQEGAGRGSRCTATRRYFALFGPLLHECFRRGRDLHDQPGRLLSQLRDRRSVAQHYLRLVGRNSYLRSGSTAVVAMMASFARVVSVAEQQ